jgi:hypothetical protein
VVLFSQGRTLQKKHKHPVFNALHSDLNLHTIGCKAVTYETILEWNGNSSGSGGYLRVADHPARELRPAAG